MFWLQIPENIHHADFSDVDMDWLLSNLKPKGGTDWV